MTPALIGIALIVVAFFLLTRVGKTSPEEARKLVASGAKLVDVRSPSEFASGHIQGAVNIPLSELGRRRGELSKEGKPVVLYCHSGARSGQGARVLKQAGLTAVYDLGAMSRW